MEADRLGLEPAGLLDPGPEAAQGPELGDGQELVRVRDERKASALRGRLEAGAPVASSARR